MGLGLGFFLRTKTKIWEYIYIPVIIKNKYEETFLGKLASICIFFATILIKGEVKQLQQKIVHKHPMKDLRLWKTSKYEKHIEWKKK